MCLMRPRSSSNQSESVVRDIMKTLNFKQPTQRRMGHVCTGFLKNVLTKSTLLLAAVGIGTGASTSALADVIFTGSLPSDNLSASATFTHLGGGNLQITLANTYTGDTPDQSHVLTALFFSGVTGLTPVSALAASGSLQWVAGTSTPAGGMDVGGNWQYLSGSGISSAGFGVFSSGNFPPSPSTTLDGSAWGLLSAGYAGSALDGLDGRTYVQDTVVFTLSGFAGSLSDITGVSFQYGTTLTEPNVTAVPEPTALIPVALLTAVIWLGGQRRLFRNRAA